jgi:hypothetical protein
MLAAAITHSPGEQRDSAAQRRNFSYPASMVILIHVGFGSSSFPGISPRNKGHAEHKEVLEFDITEKEK